MEDLNSLNSCLFAGGMRELKIKKTVVVVDAKVTRGIQIGFEDRLVPFQFVDSSFIVIRDTCVRRWSFLDLTKGKLMRKQITEL